MKFLEWVELINERNWQVCSMFQLPVNTNPLEFQWKVVLGYRGKFLCMSEGVGRNPAIAIKHAWGNRKTKFIAAKQRHADTLQVARDKLKPKKKDDDAPLVRVKLSNKQRKLLRRRRKAQQEKD